MKQNKRIHMTKRIRENIRKIISISEPLFLNCH